MRTKTDPTGQAKNRRKGTRTINKRLGSAERKIKAMFRAIPRTRRTETKIVNAERQAVYDYEVTPQEQESIEAGIQRILNAELLETQGNMPPGWYWQDNIEQPYRQGTAVELNRFNMMITAAVAAGVLVRGMKPREVIIPSVLLSPTYQEAVQTVYVSNFQTFKTLSDRTASQVIQQLNAGIQAGDTPTKIAGSISSRFNVARSSAERISRTEVNKAYNDAKINANDIAAEESGLRAGVIHQSALIQTTRASHAARHGNAYTTADQLSWWNEGSNRINCLCTTISVLIDRQGKVVQTQTQKEIKAERSFFDG